MKIGVFDSGIGGLTVLKELIKKYPNNQYYYFGDNKNIPYGTKSKEELLNLVKKIISFLNKKDVDLIIIACGTVSSNIYEELKLECSIPIYDIISPTIRYINNSDFENVGLLATPMTVESKVFEKQINKKMTCCACPKLVPLMEDNCYGKELDEAINEYIYKLKEVDSIILGCTHYPILSDKIKEKSKANLINMGTILCNELEIKQEGKKEVRLYFSKVNHNLIENINRILDVDYQLEEV